MIVNFQSEQWLEESTRNTNNKKTGQPVWWTRQMPVVTVVTQLLSQSYHFDCHDCTSSYGTLVTTVMEHLWQQRWNNCSNRYYEKTTTGQQDIHHLTVIDDIVSHLAYINIYIYRKTCIVYRIEVSIYKLTT